MTGLRLCMRRRRYLQQRRRRALFKHSKAKRGGRKKSSARFCMLNQHRVCSLFKLQFSPCSVCRARSTLIKYYTSESYLKTNIHTNYQEGNIFLPNSHHHHRTQTRTFLSVNIYWEQSLLVFICPLYSVPTFNSLQCENHTQLPFASWSNFFILLYLLYTFLGRSYFSNSLFVTSNDQQMPMAAKPFLPTSCNNPSFFALVFFLFTTFTLAPDIWYWLIW